MLNIWARVSVVILYTDNSQRFFFRKFSYLCLYEGSDDKENDIYRTDIDDFIAWQWDSQLCLIYTSESRKKNLNRDMIVTKWDRLRTIKNDYVTCYVIFVTSDVLESHFLKMENVLIMKSIWY